MMRLAALSPLAAVVSCTTTPLVSGTVLACTVTEDCRHGRCTPSTTLFDVTLSEDRATATLLFTATQTPSDAAKLDAGPITYSRQTSDVQIGTLSYAGGHNDETLLDIDEQTLTRAALTEFWSHDIRTLTATCADKGQP